MGVERIGYVEPGVRVYQTIEGINAPLSDVPLNPILVGACYKVVERSAISPDSFKIEELYTSATPKTFIPTDWLALPSLPPGAIVQQESVTLFITGEAEVGTIAQNDIRVAANDHKTAYIKGALADALKSGDRFQQTNSTSNTSCYIDYIDDKETADKETVVHLKNEIDLSDDIVVYRKYENYPIKQIDDPQPFRVDAADLIIFNSEPRAHNAFKFTGKCTISISYTALRKDVVGMHRIRTFSELTDLMEIDIQNPLGFLAAQSISTGTSIYLYVTKEDGANALCEAVEELSGTGIYYLIPIIGGDNVANVYMNYVVAKTKPEIGDFMMAMIAPSDAPVTQRTIATV